VKFISNHNISRIQWIDLLNSNNFASPFQSPDYFDLLNSIEPNSAFVLAVVEGKKLLALVVVNLQKEQGISGFFSRRAIVYGGPLIETSEYGMKAFPILLRGLQELLRGKSIYCEIRNNFDFSLFKNIYKAEKWKYEPHLNVQIQITGKTQAEILSEMKYARRREIRLATEAGVQVRQTSNEEEIQAFFSILYKLYKKKIKLPLPSFNYFKTVFLHPPGITFIVEYQGQIKGGAFCLYSPQGSIYTLYYAGLRDNKIFPTTFAVYGAIEFAIKQKLTSIDLMGAGKPGLNYGVRDFKMEFGGNLVEFGRYRKILNPVLYNVGESGLKILQKFG